MSCIVRMLGSLWIVNRFWARVIFLQLKNGKKEREREREREIREERRERGREVTD